MILDEVFIQKISVILNLIIVDEYMNFNEKINILWVDDEIDLLKPHIMFLEQRGYNLVTANNGATALDLVTEQHFDLVFLDENMPGLTGLETLVHIKNNQPNLQVIMITKSEEKALWKKRLVLRFQITLSSQ